MLKREQFIMASKRLSDEEKKTLLLFYKENPPLWDGTNPYHKNKEMREKLKLKLAELFDDLYSVEHLDKAFHSLRASLLRELKKQNEHAESQESDVPIKKWKFMDEMDFLVQEINREKKKTSFNENEMEEIIDFYRDNPALWNHLVTEYRDRTLREALMSKLRDQLDGKFSIEEIKAAWHNTLTHYKKEKVRKEASRTKSGSGLGELYISQWEFYNSMEFVDVTCSMDETVDTLDNEEPQESADPPAPPPKKKTKGENEKEKAEKQVAKIELWKALANSLSNQSRQQNNHSIQQKTAEPSSSSQQNNLEIRANLFGKLVADNLLQCDVSDWTYLKKKIMDLFFEYEQQKITLPPVYQIPPERSRQPGPYTALLRQDPQNVNMLDRRSFSPNSSYSNDSFGN